VFLFRDIIEVNPKRPAGVRRFEAEVEGQKSYLLIWIEAQ
jgi:hypothetical protein